MSMMRTIRIHFCDFSSDFDVEQSFFFKVLSTQYRLILDSEKPEFVFYSSFGQTYLDYDCIRIFYTGENLRPDFNVCDYAIGFDYLDFEGRYLRFPSYAMDGDQFDQLVQPTTLAEERALQRKFCNFIYSNANADPERDRFFHLLSDYQQVDSIGPHLTNCTEPIGARYASDWRESKVITQQAYKFSIAFENALGNGYTTEKLMHAFISGTVPIYWGNPRVAEEFNTAAFVNVHDYENLDAAVAAVRELDRDPQAYLEMLKAPAFRSNTVPQHLEAARFLEFLKPAFDPSSKSGRRRPEHGTTCIYEDRLKRLERMRRRFGLIDRVLNKLLSKG